MLEIFGTTYYIDIDAAIEKCRPIYPIAEENETLIETIDAPELEPPPGEAPPEAPPTPSGAGEINIFKFEIVKACIERMLGEYESSDEQIAAFAEKSLSPSFKIAFNTLLKYEILKEENE